MSIADLMKSIDASDDSARRTTSATSHSLSSLDAFEGALVTWNLMGRMGRALNVPGPNDARTTVLAPSFLEDPLQRCQDSLSTQHELGKRLALIESQMAALRLEAERLRAEATVAAANLIEVLRNAYRQDASVAKLTACAPMEPQLAISLVPEETDGHPKMSSRYVGPRGEVWLGKGRYPKWLKAALSEGRQLSDFAASA